MGKYIYFDREISWLAFNYRVLQEARDPAVPIIERIKFMAIYSSNLDEFYRVRVASLRNLLELKRKTQKRLAFDPVKFLQDINSIVHQQQEELGEIFREQILPELKKNGIHLIQNTQLNDHQAIFVREYFSEEVVPLLQPTLLSKNKITHFLKNKSIYFSIKLISKSRSKKVNGKSKIRPKYGILEIPSPPLPRFVDLNSRGNSKYIIFLDDIIRYCIQELFPGYSVNEMYSFKLTRDAEIYIDDEFSGNLLQKIKKGISKRKTGLPCRFLYDLKMPKETLEFLKRAFALNREDLLQGGRYHNFNDFISFPNLGVKRLEYRRITPLRIKSLDSKPTLFHVINNKDHMLFYPYHSYQYLITFLKQAALDKNVTEIYITLYRVASDSLIIKNLILAANQGKSVIAFVEIKARFDEESNISWAEELENCGVKVLYSFPGLKVHAKLCLVRRKEAKVTNSYAYLASGNFNEKTARIYTDIGFFTADTKITGEVLLIFRYLMQRKEIYPYKHLLVAPFNMREIFHQNIDNEIKNAKRRQEAEIIVKVNSLQDKKIIAILYRASKAGVKIRIIVRGICCLIPGIKGMSENIEVISIVDRYLEHARIFMFLNGGKRKYFISSADWMQRNLNRRIEVAFPVYDVSLQKTLQTIIDIQLNDNVKSRLIDKNLKNKYRHQDGSNKIRSQIETQRYLNKIS